MSLPAKHSPSDLYTSAVRYVTSLFIAQRTAGSGPPSRPSTFDGGGPSHRRRRSWQFGRAASGDTFPGLSRLRTESQFGSCFAIAMTRPRPAGHDTPPPRQAMRRVHVGASRPGWLGHWCCCERRPDGSRVIRDALVVRWSHTLSLWQVAGPGAFASPEADADARHTYGTVDLSARPEGGFWRPSRPLWKLTTGS